MRIALISQPFDAIVPPSLNSIGIWINEVSRRLAKQNEVIVYGRRGLASRKEIGENVITRYVYSLPNPWLAKLSSRVSSYGNPKKPLFSSKAYYLEFILPIALDLKRRKVEIVHLQNFSQFVPVIRAFNPDIKIALHMRCDWLALLDYKMIDQRLQQTDLVFGVSNDITEAIRQRFPQHAAKCHTAYTGVDIEDFRPAEQSAGHEKKDQRILFVGRITPEKGIHVLLEAFKAIADDFPNLELDLVGSISSLPRDRLVGLSEDQQIHDLDVFYTGTDYMESLKAILPEHLKERVHYAGHVKYATTIEYYQQAAILINPSLNEPFGRSLIEANACGVPTIASSVGGMVELIEHGKNGLLVQPGDARELAQAIRALLEDDHLRRRMGAAGRQFVVDRFSWESIASKLLSIYEDTLDSRNHEKGELTKRHAH